MCESDSEIPDEVLLYDAASRAAPTRHRRVRRVPSCHAAPLRRRQERRQLLPHLARLEVPDVPPRGRPAQLAPATRHSAPNSAISPFEIRSRPATLMAEVEDSPEASRRSAGGGMTWRRYTNEHALAQRQVRRR